MIKFVCLIIKTNYMTYLVVGILFIWLVMLNILYWIFNIFSIPVMYCYTSSSTKYIAIGERKLVYGWAFISSNLTIAWYRGSKLEDRKLSASYFLMFESILLYSFIDYYLFNMVYFL
jgi:hypothetical protein